MTDADLCARGLHPRPVEGPCPKCHPTKDTCANGHDLTAEGATYVGKNDGRARCRQCRTDRKARARQRAKERKARRAKDRAYRADLRERNDAKAAEEAARQARLDALPKVPPGGIPGQVKPVEAARYRLAVSIRRQRGLL